MNAHDTAGKIVVLGYGNTLRGDDGVGPWIAQALADRAGPDVLTLVRHQLTPELAEVLAPARLVIFVDARSDQAGSSVTVVPVRVDNGANLPTHTGDPGTLLALTQTVFGQVPPAWLVTVAGLDFGLRETLTPTARRHAEEAQRLIEKLIRSDQRLIRLGHQ